MTQEAYNAQQQAKIDRNVAGIIWEGRRAYNIGDSIQVEYRMGDEGPGSWSRTTATIEQKHIDMAAKMEAEYVCALPAEKVALLDRSYAVPCAD